jgi:small-conductance mechanosensitive channel
MIDFDPLVRYLGQPGLLLELGLLLGCLIAAYGICWLIGRRHEPDSVWFGRGVVDGLLFPLLALALTYSATLLLAPAHRLLLLKIVVPMLISLAGIRFLARVLTVVFPRSGMARLIERLFSWLAWIAAVLWIVGLLPAVMDEMEAIHFAFGKSKVSLLGVVQGVLWSGVVLVVALWISAALERKVLRDAVQDQSLRKVAASAIRAVLVLVGLLVALSAVGVDLTALSVLGGALGVGLGFGMQKLAANYVSGFIILFERSLRIGDSVKIDTFEGVVVDIKSRYTLIRSLAGVESIVPNEKLVTERVENMSLADPVILLSTDVTVGYDSDVERVQRILVEAASGAQRVIADPPPGARLARLGADGLEFKLLFWIADPQLGQLNVCSDVNLRVLQGLRAAGVEIPFPQRVVHLRQPEREAVSSATTPTG